MPARTLPGLGLSGFWDLGQGSWKDGMDANLRLLSAVSQLVVLSQTTALPASPANGAIYIVLASDPTNPGKIAVRDNGAWVYITPQIGWLAKVVDTDAFYEYKAGGWTLFGSSSLVDLGFFYPGTPAASEVIASLIFKTAITFPANFAGSVAKLLPGILATASTVLTIKKNGTSVGTITFAAGAGVGTWSTSGAVSFAVDDDMTLVAPATPDATFAGLRSTWHGSKT